MQKNEEKSSLNLTLRFDLELHSRGKKILFRSKLKGIYFLQNREIHFSYFL